jgi:alpha-amylase
LGFPGTDEIITNTKFFGNDLNTFSLTVKQRYQAWGTWLVNTVGFDGFRLDFVRGFQESYVADWVKNLPLKNGAQRFIVGEYWGPDYRIKNWVNAVAANGADVDGFDFPLKFTLTSMCNSNADGFDMRGLNNAGLVRNGSGNSLPGTSVVTWLENHDTGKEHDKWVTKDWKMGYAYILTHEGRPCVFYNHYFGDIMKDAHNASLTVTPDPALGGDIRKLIFARKTYLGGGLTVLSQSGNPVPSGDAYNVYIARRGGNATKSGAIVVINNHDSQTKGLWVDAAPAGWASWSGQILVNAFNPSQTAQVYADGRVFLSAPARGYAVYVRQSEYVAYVDPGARTTSDDETGALKEEEGTPEVSIWANPTKGKMNVLIATPRTQEAMLELITTNGFSMLQQQTITNRTTEMDLTGFPKGMYLLRASVGKYRRTEKVIKE